MKLLLCVNQSLLAIILAITPSQLQNCKDDYKELQSELALSLNESSAVVLLGPRQVGKTTLALFEPQPQRVKLALLDVVMPYIGGPPLAAKLREINPDLPVIFVTGYDRNQVFDHKQPMRNCKMLTKPYHYPELGRLVEEYISHNP